MVSYTIAISCIRETRKQRGLSAEELAEIADLSTVYISYIVISRALLILIKDSKLGLRLAFSI